jgi:hypothetical protein
VHAKDSWPGNLLLEAMHSQDKALINKKGFQKVKIASCVVLCPKPLLPTVKAVYHRVS